MNTKADRIHKKLWDKVDSEDESLTINVVDKVIKKVAGWHPKTVERYTEMLEETGIIERDGQLVTVSKYETESVDYTGELKAKHVTAPKSLLETAENVNVNASHVFAEALAERLNAKKELVSDSLNDDFDENEADVMWRFVSNNVYGIRSDNAAEQRVQEIRERVYCEVYDIGSSSELSVEHLEHIDELRNEAFKLGEELL